MVYFCRVLEFFLFFSCNLQPIARFQGQATDVEIARKEVRNVKAELVRSWLKFVLWVCFLFIPILVLVFFLPEMRGRDVHVLYSTLEFD